MDYATLTIGDCIATPEGEAVRRVVVVTCDKPHDAEVFAVAKIRQTRAAFPGVPALLEFAADACLGQAFVDYVGVPRIRSQLTDYEFVPGEEAWAEGRWGSLRRRQQRRPAPHRLGEGHQAVAGIPVTSPRSAEMILLLDARTGTKSRGTESLVRDRMVVEDVYRLPELDLEPYRALHVSGMVDQEFLWRERDVIAGFLDAGRVVVFCGHLAAVAARLRHVRSRPRHDVPRLRGAHRVPHPVFEGVDAEDLTFRRGVAGFFARGHNPPPPGAEVLAELAGGQPVTWVDRSTTRGTVFVHAGNDLIGFADDSTAARLGPQLVDWVEAEAGGRRARQ